MINDNNQAREMSIFVPLIKARHGESKLNVFSQNSMQT